MIRPLILLTLVFGFSLARAQQSEIIKFEALQKIMADDSKKIHVINFWATWCGPCIQELPYFERINAANHPEVKVTLVSLDLELNPNPEKVFRFIDLKKLRSDIVLLDESDPNSWINKVDKRWSGALPATILINHETGKRIFIGKALREGELEKYLSEIETNK